LGGGFEELAAGEFLKSFGGGGFHRVLVWEVGKFTEIRGIEKWCGRFWRGIECRGCMGGRVRLILQPPRKSSEVTSPSVTDWRHLFKCNAGEEGMRGVQE
jgi:hypothetical protein